MVERQSVDTTLGRWAVFQLGAGPATLLWPSLYVDHRSLLPMAADLARTRRCILIDPPGHGRSAVPGRRFTLWDCARATEQLLDALGAGAVDFIGNAWGGHVGICMARAWPSRVRTLIAISSPLEPLSAALRWKTRAGLVLLSLGARATVGKLVADAMLAPSPAAAHGAYVEGCIRDAPDGGIRCAVESVSLSRPDFTGELARVTTPVLVVAGAEDPIWPPEAARRAAASLSGARCHVVPAAGHLAPLERPRETLAAIAPFLDEHSAAHPTRQSWTQNEA